MESLNKKKQDIRKGDELNLLEVSKLMWEKRWFIVKTTSVFILIGLFIALFSKKEYTSSTTMVPQVYGSSPKLGGLSSLASLAGFNLELGGNADILPVLYPKIVNSIQFQLELMNTKYEFEEIDHKITLLDYYENYYKPGFLASIKSYTVDLPDLLIKRFSSEGHNEQGMNNEIIRLTEDEDELREKIEEQLKLEVYENEGYLVLTSSFPQPKLAAQVALKARQLLQEYITAYKTEKAMAQLEFIEERFVEKKLAFEKIQAKLAEYRDENKNVTSALIRTEEERLENEYQLSFDVYSELAKQLEQAKIKIKEDTPVFSIIEEVNIPIKRSKPKRTLIMIIWIILGGFASILLILSKRYLSFIKQQWRRIDVL